MWVADQCFMALLSQSLGFFALSWALPFFSSSLNYELYRQLVASGGQCKQVFMFSLSPEMLINLDSAPLVEESCHFLYLWPVCSLVYMPKYSRQETYCFFKRCTSVSC